MAVYHSCVIIFPILRWFCHFDDDIYVNIPALAELLSQFNATEEVYLGRWSLNKKEKIEVNKIK